MSKIKKTPKAKKPKKERKPYTFAPEEYGIHLGLIIRQTLKARRIPQKDMLPKLNITHGGFQHKMKTPTYGTIYEIIISSETMGIDLFNIIRQELVKGGHPLFAGVEGKLENELNEARRKINLLIQENQMLEKLAQMRDQIKGMG
ncbi:MAG: hypothetical protein V9E90_01330 [Saprospiraceae bacterium]